jgi:hypothetical protein
LHLNLNGANGMKLETLTKPKKGEAFQLVVKAVNGETLTPYEASLLVNYFSPALPAKSKTAWGYVSKILDPSESRRALHYVNVKDGVAYASDGKRLHFAPTEKPDGVYAPSGIEAERSMEYIDSMLRVLPKNRNPENTIRMEDVELQRDDSKADGVQLARFGDMYVDIKYLMPAINHQESFKYSVVENGLLVECDHGKALVAPYRV